MNRRHLLGGLFTAGAAIARPRQAAAIQSWPARRAPDRIVAKDGTRLHYRDWGQGRPIVLAAPWALGVPWWDHQLATLTRQGFRCVAYDRRGHGSSDAPDRGYDFDTLADDLAAVIDQLSLRDAVLVGHSMGAAEVVRYLARHRAAHATGAVLIATITPITVRTADNPQGVPADALEQARQRLAQDRPGQIADAAAAFFGAPASNVSPATMDAWTRALVDGCSLRVMLDLHKAMTETDFRADLRQVRVPTLLIHGDRDTSAILDRTSRRTHEAIAGSELKIYEGAAHGLVVTHAERLNADVIAFARR